MYRASGTTSVRAMGMYGRAQWPCADFVGGVHWARGATRARRALYGSATWRRWHSTTTLSCVLALVVGYSVSLSGGEVSVAQFIRVLEDLERADAGVDHYTATRGDICCVFRRMPPSAITAMDASAAPPLAHRTSADTPPGTHRCPNASH
jgi:hypothetical protein